MAEIQKKKSTGTSNTPPPSIPSKSKTYFFACFGFSRKGRHNTRRSKYAFPLTKKETNYIRSHHDHHPFQDQKVNIMKSTSTSTRRRWYLISWSSLRSSKSATKTVPIDTSTTTSLDGKRKRERQPKDNYGLETTNSKSKSKSGNITSDLERDVPVTDGGSPPGGPASQMEVVLHPVPDLPQQTPLITQNPSETNTINLENRKPLESSKGDTCIKRVSFCRKIDSLRNSGSRTPSSQSQPGSPVQETKKPKSSSASTRTATAVMSHSASFPTPRIDQSGPPAAVVIPAHNKRYSSWSWSTSTVSSKGAPRNNQAESSSTIIMSKKLDPLVGMSIIMVTLIIMLLWGRLCAILCTSAWFYFLPRLRSAAGSTSDLHGDQSPRYYNSNPNFMTSNNSRDLDLNSKEFKKKVVLEGFLERNRRNNIP